MDFCDIYQFLSSKTSLNKHLRAKEIRACATSQIPCQSLVGLEIIDIVLSFILFMSYVFFRLLLAIYLPISNEPKVIAVNNIANAQSSGSGAVTSKAAFMPGV